VQAGEAVCGGITQEEGGKCSVCNTQVGGPTQRHGTRMNGGGMQQVAGVKPEVVGRPRGCSRQAAGR